MTTICSTISVLCGILMLTSGSRRRFPCFIGGSCALLSGSFMLLLPWLNTVKLFGWIWFCAWLVALPSLAACVIALVDLAEQRKASAYCVALGIIALVANIPPALSFWSAAVTGVVNARDNFKAEQSGCRQRLAGHLSCHRRLPLTVADPTAGQRATTARPKYLDR